MEMNASRENGEIGSTELLRTYQCVCVRDNLETVLYDEVMWDKGAPCGLGVLRTRFPSRWQ